MTLGRHRPARLTATAFACGLLVAAGPVAAEEWHEAYHLGLAALARGDAPRAIEALRRAVALRPEPGRNVVTYGTNVEPRYFPYLRLAEAYLAGGQLEAARDALATSATWKVEPADERQKLLARLEVGMEERRPHALPQTLPPAAVTPPTTPGPVPPTTVVPETPVPAPSLPPPTIASPAGTLQVAPRNPRASATAPAPTRPPEGPSITAVPAPPATEAATGALEIASQPGGASVYVDDELVGSTDPETGRLVKRGLPAGRHRVRMARAGNEDAARDIDIPKGGSATFYAVLKPRGEGWLGARGAVIALVASALVALLARIGVRRPREALVSIWTRSSESLRTLTGKLPTPSGANPGMQRDELGHEWFGDFRLLELLGRGGMASVFKAERRGELLALKRPLASFLEDPQFLERFLREAEIGRTLNHPNIVRILERGDVGRVPFFAMELVEGQTLEAYIRGHGATEARTAASIVAQVAEALDFAHGKGVIHRDLKPSNVMLLPGGTAKVMDFGIARARRFESLTATGVFVGTPHYVAPEMIEEHLTDPRSDLYSLGVILFELLTGERPFSGETAFEVLRKHCDEEPPPPSRIHPGVPAELAALTMRLLRKDPGERPATAEELVVSLRDWLNRAA